MFNPQIQNDQCQEMDTTADKWVKLTDNGEWGSHSVSLCLFVFSPTNPHSAPSFSQPYKKKLMNKEEKNGSLIRQFLVREEIVPKFQGHGFFVLCLRYFFLPFSFSLDFFPFSFPSHSNSPPFQRGIDKKIRHSKLTHGTYVYICACHMA